MKGIKYIIVFLVLSASLMCTSEAARSRTSNQNSFRRAANGIYQTLSSVFGEDNIKGLYKVKTRACISQRYGSGSEKAARQAVILVNGGKETSALRPDHPFNGCHFGMYRVCPASNDISTWVILHSGYFPPGITLELSLNGGHSLLAWVASVHRCKWEPLVQPV